MQLGKSAGKRSEPNIALFINDYRCNPIFGKPIIFSIVFPCSPIKFRSAQLSSKPDITF